MSVKETPCFEAHFGFNMLLFHIVCSVCHVHFKKSRFEDQVFNCFDLLNFVNGHLICLLKCSMYRGVLLRNRRQGGRKAENESQRNVQKKQAYEKRD
jgi:hypothetical protein